MGGVTAFRGRFEAYKNRCSTWNIGFLFELVPRAGLEPARRIRARDFKSRVSTNFTTEADGYRKPANIERG